MWESSVAGLERRVPQSHGASRLAAADLRPRRWQSSARSQKLAVVSTLLAAWCLLGLTVTIHAAGLSAMLPGLSSAVPDRRFWSVTWQVLGPRGG